MKLAGGFIFFIFTLTWGNDPSWIIHIFHLGWVSPNIWNSWSSLHPWTLGYSVKKSSSWDPVRCHLFSRVTWAKRNHISVPHKTSYFLHTFETWFDENNFFRAKKIGTNKFREFWHVFFFLLKGWLFALVFQGAWHTHQVSEFNTRKGVVNHHHFPWIKCRS